MVLEIFENLHKERRIKKCWETFKLTGFNLRLIHESKI